MIARRRVASRRIITIIYTGRVCAWRAYFRELSSVRRRAGAETRLDCVAEWGPAGVYDGVMALEQCVQSNVYIARGLGAG